ncbi:MAG: endospore germination permease [Acetanaerobacterium sp.]
MRIVKAAITPRQLLFACAAFVQGSSLLTSLFVGVLRQNSWLGVVTAYLLTLPILWIYLALLSRHPGKSLIEINDIVYGRIFGKLFSAFYIFYFFSLIALNAYDVYSFVIGYMMPNTPPEIIALLFVLLPILAARKGVEILVHIAPLICIIQLISLPLFAFLQLNDMNPSNLLPLFNMPIRQFTQGTSTIVALPFCEIIVFLMIIPGVDDQKKAAKSVFGGFSIGAGVLFIIVMSNILVLGPTMEYFNLPQFESIRLIDVAEIINRMDTLYALLLYLLRFFKVSILVYACALALAQMNGLTKYRPFVSILGVMAALLSMFIHESSPASFEWGEGTAAVFSSIFNIALPAVTLLVSLLRGGVTKRRQRSAVKT